MNHELIEKEFLSIIYFNPKVAFDLLQIKPNYLKNPKNKLILEAIINCYEKYGTLSLGNIVSYNNSLTYEYVTDAIADENITVVDYRKNFMVCQDMILSSYKKESINYLTQKLNKGELNCDDYFIKIKEINEIHINTITDNLSKEELINNISTKNKGIILNGFSQLNNLLKLVQNDFVMIGASTGVGKSGLLLNFMNALRKDYQCIYFNMEMSKTTIYKRMISIAANVPIYNIEKPETDYQKELVEKAINELSEDNILIEHKATYLHEIRNILKVAKNDKKHTILFLDHVGLIKNTNSKSQYEQMTDVAKQLRQICLDYDCTIIAACQLNRSSYNSNDLNLSMLKDSGELENSSSKVILLSRDKEDVKKSPSSLTPKMLLEIVKNRDGMLGTVTCKYDKAKQIFSEVSQWT